MENYMVNISTKTKIPNAMEFLVENMKEIYEEIKIERNNNAKNGTIIIGKYNIYWIYFDEYHGKKNLLNIDIFIDKKYLTK